VSTVLILAHPDFTGSRANRALLDGLAGVPDLELVELYALYPDGQISYAVERERILRAGRLVLQFPLQWYSVPALLKQWMDSVLTPLFFGEPHVAASTAGLGVLAATTLGGPEANYQRDGANAMTVNDLFAPLRATSGRCNWQWQAPFALYDVRNLDAASLARAAARYRTALLSVPVLKKQSQALA
jgi:putative NADPH-quinone reductase